MSESALAPLSADADPQQRKARYEDVLLSISGLLEGEDDWVAAMATVACELHRSFAYFDWTGFYRAVREDLLIVGPYQGGHGCLRIEGGRGVCGAAATKRETRHVPDVESFEGHIACSSSTRSELVVPIQTPGGRLLAVLDVDSDLVDAFDAVDVEALEALCADLGRRFAPSA